MPAAPNPSQATSTTAAAVPQEVLRAFESVPDLYLVLSPDLTILTASNLYLAAMQLRREDILAKSVFNLFPDIPLTAGAATGASLRYSLEQVLQQQQAHQMGLVRYDVPLHAGAATYEERYWRISHTPVADSNGATWYIVQKVTDETSLILNQRQVAARLPVKQSTERMQLIIDALPVLIGYLDREEKYRFANKAYEVWFNQNPADLLGRSVREVVGEAAYQGVKQYIERALAGERLNFESRMPYRQDFVKYIRTSYVPHVQDGQVAGFFTLVNDITEQEEARQQLEKSALEAQTLTRELAATNAELSASNELLTRTNIDLDNFIYTASHDLKAPIYNIEGLLQILLEVIPPDVLASQELETITDMMSDSIGRFKRTIDHLTEIIKLQKENTLQAELVDLQEVISNVCLDLSTQIAAAGARLSVDVAAYPAVHFAEKHLRSIVYNLLSNAIKYSSPDRTPDILISCYPASEYVVLQVQDNGLGMHLPEDSKLFSMFGRLHDHVEGSGIGLYMVKKIVENADGHIEVDSEVGVGTTFKVYLKC